ncbi:MAG: twin-arginine translocase TatA/TatE family subunit [Candidatus Omnitrophica bacterium]|nr:twin-arginine translocase TatA/TatE family subunit [Candidatus Omnitrophota bacterium]
MNLGWGELLVVLAIILLIVGARRLPEIGRALGQSIRAFQEGLREKKPHDDDKDPSQN